MEKYKKIINFVKFLKNEKLSKLFIDFLIKKQTKLSKELNGDYNFIGYNLDINGHFEVTEEDVIVKYSWMGFVPYDTKIIYGIYYYKPKDCSTIGNMYNVQNNTFTSLGSFYYNDDFSYIYDFFKYIINYDVQDEMHLHILLYDFISDYFDTPYSRTGDRDEDREQIHCLIQKDSRYFYESIKKHSIKDFYGNNTAMCSEISLIVQNILSVLGFEIVYIIDNNHAYNMLLGDNVSKIIDYSNGIDIYDLNFDAIRVIPFVQDLPDNSPEFINDFLDRKFGLAMNNQFGLKINDKYFIYLQKDTKRIYGQNDDLYVVDSNENELPKIVLSDEKETDTYFIQTDNKTNYVKILSSYDEISVDRLTRKRK